MEAQRERSRTTWAGSDRLQAQAGSAAAALPTDVAQGVQRASQQPPI